MSPTPSTLEDLTEIILALPRAGRRHLVAIAGPPASGKSTLSARLAAEVTRRGRAAKVIPMDGFHLDNADLISRALLERKGAPETFDAQGFAALVAQLKRPEKVRFPLFDRAADASVPDGDVIEDGCDIAILEGNYLLFGEPPWHELRDNWSVSIWIDVPEDTIRQRCVARWLDHGMPHEAALARAEVNDLRNARRILEQALPADFVIGEF